mgnify:CR=1 FL=1
MLNAGAATTLRTHDIAGSGKPDGHDALYSSQYLGEVFLNAAQRSAVQCRSLLPLPAAYSDVTTFDEVQLRW